MFKVNSVLKTFLIVFLSFISSAETTVNSLKPTTVIEMAMPGDREKKNKRVNKKRKKKCKQFGRRIYAG